MPNRHPPATPDRLRLVLVAACFAVLPIKADLARGDLFETAAAWAKGGDDDGSDDHSGSGGGSGSDDSSDSDDHSGSGGNSGSGGGSGSDDDDDTDDDDGSGSNSGSGKSGTGGSGGSSGGSTAGSGGGKGAVPVARIVMRGGDIAVTYADGWSESIKAGRYVMTDPRHRTVIDRPARGADRVRLLGYRP